MYNVDIRETAKKTGVKLWEIAERYNGGISDGNFSRKLRRELPSEEKEKIFRIIEEITQEQEADNNE